MPEEFGGADLANQTLINPLALAITFLTAAGMSLLPRRQAPMPFLFAVCYITLAQRVVVGGLDFTMMRILVIVGWLRLIIRGEIYNLNLNIIDVIIITWTVTKIVTYTMLWQTTGALINRLGNSYDTIGMYFMFRFFFHDLDDVNALIKTLVFVMMPLALFMMVEFSTGRNLFSMLGGVPEYTSIRDGRVRCQGPFRHAILAGTFGATILPMAISLWWQGGNGRILAMIGFLLSTIIVACSTSSGPALAYVSTLGVLGLWVMRRHMSLVKWTAILSVIGMQLMMNSPVWWIFARLSDQMGGSGWHRSLLIDRGIKLISDWWLLGTKSTAHWGHFTFDVSNGYLHEGVTGGLFSLLLFVAIIFFCFRRLGQILRSVADFPTSLKFLLWALGASLAAHTVSLISVSYFDQIIAFWFLLLAMISTLSGQVYVCVNEPDDAPAKANWA